MALLGLTAEGVGPFERLDIDFSDGHGNPHLGPHILAGVNGSGKSTVLRTIAWVMDRGVRGFNYDEWQHLLKGYSASRSLLALKPVSGKPYALSCEREDVASLPGLLERLSPALATWGIVSPRLVRVALPTDLKGKANSIWRRIDSEGFKYGLPSGPTGRGIDIAGYSPTKNLRHLPNPNLTATLSDPSFKALAFEGTVQNQVIQAWLLSLYSKKAIAKERRQPTEDYTRALYRFESALQLVYGGDVQFDVEIEPNFQPRLRIKGHSLNFSQLPDGVRGTVGWIADFMMRQDAIKWDPLLEGRRPGILLLDEVDAHLHPLWQRRLLPAMREALPDVQIIVTSHSPFVISSCPGSRVHVFELDEDGRAHNRPPVDSPIGESVLTTLKEIFGVNSRFDIRTEAELDEWNRLKRRDAAHHLSPDGERRLSELTEMLSQRSEELRSLVGSPREIPASVLHSLLQQ
jgi:hypothetical protein